MHFIRDCEEVAEFWTSIIRPENWAKFFSLSLHAWVDWNLTEKEIGHTPWKWSIFFGVAVNALWKDRKSLIFSQHSDLKLDWWYMLSNQVSFITQDIHHPSEYIDCVKTRNQVYWEPPIEGAYKLNVDGSHNWAIGKSACGGLIRDSKEKSLKVFTPTWEVIMLFMLKCGHFSLVLDWLAL
jgi:hypothetical protein